MTIRKMIDFLEKHLEENADGEDMEISIYAYDGDRIEPKSLGIGSISQGNRAEDYAYFSDLL